MIALPDSWEDEIDFSLEDVLPVVTLKDKSANDIGTITMKRLQQLAPDYQMLRDVPIILTCRSEQAADMLRIINYPQGCSYNTLTDPVNVEMIRVFEAAIDSTILSETIAGLLGPLKEAWERKQVIAKVNQKAEEKRREQAENTKNAPRRGRRFQRRH